MTTEHRRQCRNALWNWGLIEQQPDVRKRLLGLCHAADSRLL